PTSPQQSAGAVNADGSRNSPPARIVANPNSSARYGSPFMSQYRWSALTVGGSPASPRNRAIRPSPVQTVSVLISFDSRAVAAVSTSRAAVSLYRSAASAEASRTNPAASPGMNPYALFSGPAEWTWSFASSHSRVSG